MSSENVGIVRRAYADFARGDLEAVLAAVSPDVEWLNSDELPNGGVARNRDELRAMFEMPAELWDGYHVEVEQMLDAGNHVVVLGTQRAVAKATAKPLDAPLAAVYRLADGHIVWGRQFPDTAKALKALGSA